MKTIFSYNLTGFDATQDSLLDIYIIERNASFGAVYIDERTKTYYAVTDHLGNVPVFYMYDGADEPVFSLNPMDFLKSEISSETIKRYLATGTLRFLQEHNVYVVPSGTVLSFVCECGIWKRSTFTTYEWNLTGFTARHKKTILHTLDTLLNQATKRLCKDVASDAPVSVALSGGIDSALIAHYLKKNGVVVDAFTVSPWGKQGVEALRASETAKTLRLDSHSIYDLQTDEYDDYVQAYQRVYPYPNGSVASLTISALWNKTDITKNGTVFFAQNADTMFCSVIHQFSTYLYMAAPRFVRRLVKVPYFKWNASTVENYISFAVLGNASWWKEGLSMLPKTYTRIQELSFAGMLWGHTPSDGEVFIAPGVAQGVKVRNIFYDVDVIEFVVQIPLWYRLRTSKESSVRMALTKRLLLELAQSIGVGKNYQKKGLVLPKNRDAHSAAFFQDLPTSFEGAVLRSENHQFALKMLELYGLRKNDK